MSAADSASESKRPSPSSSDQGASASGVATPPPPGRRARPGRWGMLFGLGGTAAIWFLHTEFGETLAAQVCYKHVTASGVPQWLMASIYGATVFAWIVGVLGTAVAIRNWRLTRIQYAAAQHALDTFAQRQHFLATAGLLFSVLFLCGLVAAGFAVLSISPCSALQ